jgi:NADPH2:quinone reductase
MKAIICRDPKEPLSLEYGELPSAPLGADKVRVAVKAAGVNYADSLMVTGRYQVKPPVPFSPGLEAAGDVIEVGSAVKRLKVGDRVLGLTSWGGYAEELVSEEHRFLVIPDDMDYVTAAGFSLTYGTSHLGLDYRARLKAGETLVVHGAGGGVGLTAVEVGKLMGARVIATAGAPEKLALARSRGADEVINYREEDIRDRVLEMTDGRGADVVYDPVGGDVFKASLRSMAFEGRILVIGFAGGDVPQIPANHLLVKNVDVIGFFWGAYKVHNRDRLVQSIYQLVDWWKEGRLKPHVSKTFPLIDAQQAIEYLLARKSTGKVVITVGD